MMIILSQAHAVLFLSVAKILFCHKTLVNRQIERGRNSRAFCWRHIYLNALPSMDGIAIRNDVIIFFYTEVFVALAGRILKSAIHPYAW